MTMLEEISLLWLLAFNKILSGEIFLGISTKAKNLIMAKAPRGFIMVEFCCDGLRVGSCLFFCCSNLFLGKISCWRFTKQLNIYVWSVFWIHSYSMSKWMGIGWTESLLSLAFTTWWNAKHPLSVSIQLFCNCISFFNSRFI